MKRTTYQAPPPVITPRWPAQARDALYPAFDALLAAQQDVRSEVHSDATHSDALLSDVFVDAIRQAEGEDAA